jgi:hypothetical protein
MTIRFFDYDAIPVISSASEMEESEFSEKYFLIEGQTIQDFSLSTKNETRVTFDVKMKTTSDIFEEDLLFLRPFQYNRWSENPFKAEKRTFPIDFEHTFLDNFTSVIEIPDGYELDDFPEEVSITLPGNVFIFNYNISTLDKMVKINATMELKTTIIQPDIYQELKYFMETVSSKLQEPIILKKSR